MRSMRVLSVTVLLTLFAACGTTGVAPLASDYAFADPARGVVIIGKDFVDRSGEPTYVSDVPRELVLHREGTGEELSLVSTGPPPSTQFVAALAPGYYRILAATRFSGVEKLYVLRFKDAPGGVQYAGTIRSQLDVANPRFTLRDDYDAAVQRFRKRYPNAPAEVRKTLFEKLSCNPDCVEQAWGVDGSP
jgi:hypothetical protein